MSTTIVEAEFRARLTQVIHTFDSVVAVAKAVGVSDNAIYKWLSGRGQPSVNNLVSLARAARVSIEWLATGEESKQTAAAITHAMEHGDYIFMPRNRIRFSSGREGVLSSDQVVDSVAFRAAWVKRSLNTEPRDLLLIEVDGDSMAPTVKDSDLILANLAEPRFKQDGIYLLRHDGGLTVKRIQRRPDGKLLVRSDNPKYEADGGSDGEGYRASDLDRRPGVSRSLTPSTFLRVARDAELGDEEGARDHCEAFEEHRDVNRAHHGIGKREHRGAMHDDRHRNQEQHDEPCAETRAIVEENQRGASEFDDGGDRHPERAPRNRGRHQVDVTAHRGEVGDAGEHEDQGEENAGDDPDGGTLDEQIVVGSFHGILVAAGGIGVNRMLLRTLRRVFLFSRFRTMLRARRTQK